jgi:hypothetical protein
MHDKNKLSEKLKRRVAEPEKLKGEGWIYYEDPYIYDGWCAVGNTITGEVILRDAYFIERLSDEKKKSLIESLEWNLKNAKDETS